MLAQSQLSVPPAPALISRKVSLLSASPFSSASSSFWAAFSASAFSAASASEMTSSVAHQFLRLFGVVPKVRIFDAGVEFFQPVGRGLHIQSLGQQFQRFADLVRGILCLCAHVCLPLISNAAPKTGAAREIDQPASGGKWGEAKRAFAPPT